MSRLIIGPDHILLSTRYVPAYDVRGTIRPEAIVIHYTAGASAESSINWLSKKDDVYVSAHLVIGRDGSITQLVPFDRRALHAGISEWNGRDDLNGWSVGIELANWGRVTKRGDKFYTWSGAELAADKVQEARHKNGSNGWWERYTDPQVESCIAVCKALHERYGIDIIVGHDDVAPTRKEDPGPLFPMYCVHTSVIHSDEVVEEDLPLILDTPEEAEEMEEVEEVKEEEDTVDIDSDGAATNSLGALLIRLLKALKKALKG